MYYRATKQITNRYIIGREILDSGFKDYMFNIELDNLVEVKYVCEYKKTNNKMVIIWSDLEMAFRFDLPSYCYKNKYKQKLYFEDILKMLELFGKARIYQIEELVRIKNVIY